MGGGVIPCRSDASEVVRDVVLLVDGTCAVCVALDPDGIHRDASFCEGAERGGSMLCGLCAGGDVERGGGGLC